MPYEFHPDLTTPPNATVLWRYMDFAKFVQLIDSRSLWFSQVSRLEDPLEGTHTDAELAHIRKNVEHTLARQLIRMFRTARREVYVNCWRSGSAESLAMWDLYGRGTGVVAIKSTVGRVKDAISKCRQSIFISRSKYFDWDEAPGLDNVLVACSRKDLSYTHESEVRLMIVRTSEDRALRGPGTNIPVDTERLIDQVVIGPREQKWVIQLVGHVMRKYNLSQNVLASDRLKRRR